MTMLGHNNPPDPVELVLNPYNNALAEADHWLDGDPISNANQLNVVDALAKQAKAAKKALKEARDEATKPLHDAWKAEVARWKPAEDDVDRIIKGLAAVSNEFKQKLAAEQESARRAAYEEAERKKREAEAAAKAADAGNIEAQRQAAAAKQAAIDAAKQASQTKVEVRGLRTVHRHEVTDYRAALNWIAANDRDAVVAFVDDYTRRHCRNADIAGVQTWTEKEAF